MALQRFQANAGVTPRERPNLGPRIKALYVEDEAINWDLVEFHLRERYELSRAKDAQEAIQLLMTKEFDIILLDIQLANSSMSGTELAQLIRGKYEGEQPAYAATFKPSQVPIIFMTAYSGLYTKTDIMKFGGDELVYKPIDFVYLTIVVTRLLRKMVAAMPHE